MNILAIDTATQVAGVALLSDTKLISENIIDYKLKHSKKLMVSLEMLLENVEMDYKDIDAFAVAVGPGSFTGLRIGLSTVKALAQVTGKPIIPVSTLESLAYNLYYSSGIICPMLDARRNQVYTALFKSDGKDLDRLTDDSALTLSGLNEKLNGITDTVYFLGDGAEKYYDEIDSSISKILVLPYKRTCRAASVAACALNHLNNQRTYLTIEPSYLRPSYAEENQ